MREPKKRVPEIRFKGFTKDWEQRKLGEIAEFFSGLTYSPDNVVRDGGTFVLRSSNVKNGEIVDADNVYVRSEIVKSDNVQVGDIIVVVRNGSRDLIGKHAQIKKQMNYTVIGAFMTGVRSETPNFTNTMLDTQQFSIEINKNLGATINQITTSAFKNMMFYIPIEKAERKQIGAFFNQIDNLITLHQRKLDKLKQLKKGYLQVMFPQKDESVPKLRFANFVGEWEQRKLEEAFSERSERSGVGELISVTINLGVVKASGLDRKDNSSKNKSNYKVVKVGDIAYNSMRMWQGASGYSPYNGILSPAYTVIAPKDNINSEFFSFMFKRYEMIQIFKRNSQGLTSDTWSLKFPAFSTIKTLYPTYAEQTKISTFFTEVDNTIALHQTKLDKLQDFKKAYLQKMFV